MNDINDILNCLKRTPIIFENLIDSIPTSILKMHRIPGKWSIHEHACHLIDVQPMLIDRFRLFTRESRPEFIPFIPGGTASETNLLKMDLELALKRLPKYRIELAELLKNRKEDFWLKQGIHREYMNYTPYVLLRHVLMHDHFHMYRIEELWLTTDDYLPKGNVQQKS